MIIVKPLELRDPGTSPAKRSQREQMTFVRHLPIMLSPAGSCLAVALATLVLLICGAMPAAAATVTAAEFEACQAENDEAFARAIEAVTIKTITEELKSVDYDAAVTIEWRRLGLDALIDQRVDAAVAEVRDGESWASLLKSLGDQTKAQELATAVSDKVYRSDAMRTAIEGLATAVGEHAGRRIEMASQDAAKPALNCLKTFLGPRYGSAVATAVSGAAGQDFGFDPSQGAGVSSGSVLKQSSEGLTGAAILLLRRQLANMARRVGQRLAGSVLSRLVSVAAGGVGIVLIAKDFWDLRHGVLPIIAEEMKSKDSKESVRQELVKGLTEEIGAHATEIGAASAGRVVEVWQEFKRAHAKALELAGRDPAFKDFMETVEPASFARLDEVIALLLASEGEDGILKRAADGTLATAVNKLSDAGMSIARDTGSVATALGWSAIAAGPSLQKVLDLGLHRDAKPADFTETALERVLAFDDRQASQHLAAIDRASRDALLEIGNEKLERIAHALDKGQLQTLAGYLQGLDKGPRERVLEAVAENPAAMQSLASPHVRQAVIGSLDQSAAVDMMLRPAGSASWQTAARDLKTVWEGRVRPWLIWERYPLPVIGAGFAVLMLLLWLRRLFRPLHTPPATPPPTATTPV